MSSARKGYLRWLFILLLVFSVGGCAGLNQIELAQKTLETAEAVRKEVKEDPQANLAEAELAASREHQAATEELVDKWSRVAPIDLEGKAPVYAEEAVDQADKSLAAARAAQDKIKEQAQAGPSEPVEPKPAAPPAGPPGPVTVEPEAAPKPAPIPLPQDPQSLYRFGLDQYYAGDYLTSRRALVAFLGRFPDHPLAVNAQYWIGETYYSEKQWVMSLGAFQAVLKHYPKGRKVPDALLKIGMVELQLGRRAEAVSALKRCLNGYPKSNPAVLARRQLNKLGVK